MMIRRKIVTAAVFIMTFSLVDEQVDALPKVHGSCFCHHMLLSRYKSNELRPGFSELMLFRKRVEYLCYVLVSFRNKLTIFSKKV